MKYYIIAGERSGDLHASNLIREIRKNDEKAVVRGMGGEFLMQAGTDLFKHYQEISFMGFAEVVKNLSKVKKAISQCKEDLLTFKPDVLILVDFAGFNLRIARFAHQNKIPVFYYISPKIWAWKQSRVHTIKRYVDRMYVIMPFEKAFYGKFGYESVYYVGNPLLDSVSVFVPDDKGVFPDEFVAVLPGSRRQEVEVMTQKLPDIVRQFPEKKFVVAGVNNLDKELYNPFFNLKNVEVRFEETYSMLSKASAAIVTSGTATLETALFEVPQVVVYKASLITYWIGKRLVKIPFISLVNLIAEEEVVRELIQGEFNAEETSKELRAILPGGGKREHILSGYRRLKERLGAPGASEKAARLMFQALSGKE